jgi:hypothetical protein
MGIYRQQLKLVKKNMSFGDSLLQLCDFVVSMVSYGGQKYDFFISLMSYPFFRNACTKSGSLRFSQFSGC